MKTKLIHIHSAWRRAFALQFAASLALAGGLQASTVTETFDNAASTAANGWVGVGNTTNLNNYGWSSTNDAEGAAAGEAGGIFARSSGIRYYADTNGGALSRTTTPLVMSGKFYLLNSNFDGAFRIGFFNNSNVDNNFIGIEIAEPSGGVGNPFRGYVATNLVRHTGIISLVQDVPYTFSLTWTPAVEADGSGTLAGTVAGTDIGSIAVAAGTGTFNAFGISSGGQSNVNEVTAGCYFDDLTYTEVAPATYTITYDGNVQTGGTPPSPQTKTENQPITLATNSGDLAKDGFTFAGWNTAADGTGTNYAEGATYTANGDATLYARWALPYTITYDGNDNTSGTAPDPQVALQDVPATLAINSGNLAKTDFVFSGWNTAADGTGTNYTAGASYTGNADITLYARWINYTWTQTASGTQTWATAANWQGGSIPPGTGSTASYGMTVNFTANLAANQTVGMAANRSFGGTLNIGSAANNYNFSNNTGIFRVNAGNTGTATLNLTGGSHTIQGTINLQVDELVINNNAAGGAVNIQRTLNNSTGTPTRSITLTLNAVEGAGGMIFGTVNSTTARSGFEKLVVNQHAIFINNGVVEVAGTVDDRALGRVLSEYLADAVTLNGGTLQAGRSDNTHTISENRGITLGVLGGTLRGMSDTRHWSVDSIITGSGGLTVGRSNGPSGNVTLNAANTYLGDTNVLGGTLIVTGGNAIPDTSSLKITTVAPEVTTPSKVNPSGTTETVAALFFDGVQQANGTWGATDSGATNINDAFFTGSGVINVVPVVPPSGFANWQAANSTEGGLNDDHDNDGVDNGLEWFLGGNTDTTGFTPLPGVIDTAGTLSVTWTKSADYPGAYGTDFRVETSATLDNPWTPAAEGIGAGFVEITGNDVKFTFPAGVINFARLVVTGP
jgi:autotransporter-associated beta strand protein